MRVCVNDTVVIRAGSDRGKKGRVLSIDREAEKLTVEGVAVVKKHVRRSRRNPQGGILAKAMPIPVGKVQVVCPKCGQPARIGVSIQADGSKFRVCKKCGASVSQISPAKKS